MKKNSQHTQAGFKIPDGYFEQLTDRVLEKTQKETSDEHSGFQVPKDYFTTLESRIMDQVSIEKEVQVIPLQTSSSKNWIYPLLAIAAIFIGLVVVNGLSFDDKVTFADLNDQEMRDYLVNEDFLQDDESVELLYADNTILNDTQIEQNYTDNELLDFIMEDATINQIIRE